MGNDDRSTRGFGGYVRLAIACLICLFFTLLLIGFLVGYRSFTIPSVSMKPALLPGDTILVSKHAYGLRWRDLPLPLSFTGRIWHGDEPRRGDVVIFENARDGYRHYVKRVVGMPGEVIRMKDGVLHIDGAPVPTRAMGNTVEPLGTHQNRSQVCLERHTDGPHPACVKQRLSETLPGGNARPVLNADLNRSRHDNTREYTVPEGEYFVMGDNRDNSMDSRMARIGFVPYDAIMGRVEIVTAGTGDMPYAFWTWDADRIFKRVD